MTDITPQPTGNDQPGGLPAGHELADDPGWWTDMTAWTDDRLADRGVRRRGPLVPVRIWVRSAVSWFDTDRGRMWAKAVPTVFSHEIALTELIADIDPGAAPPVVAADGDLGRIITEHVEGPILTSSKSRSPGPPRWPAWPNCNACCPRTARCSPGAGVAAAPLDHLADRVSDATRR